VTVWTWIALALVVGAWLIPWLLARRQSSRAPDAAIAGSIVTRLTVSAVFVWVIVRLLSQDDSLRRLLAVPIGLVLLLTLFNAWVAIAVLFGQKRN